MAQREHLSWPGAGDAQKEQAQERKEVRGRWRPGVSLAFSHLGTFTLQGDIEQSRETFMVVIIRGERLQASSG